MGILTTHARIDTMTHQAAPPMTYVERFAVDDAELSALHARAFGGPESSTPWAVRLGRHSVTWVGAYDADRLVGFVHAVTDGGAAPPSSRTRRQLSGREAASGCTWTSSRLS